MTGVVVKLSGTAPVMGRRIAYQQAFYLFVASLNVIKKPFNFDQFIIIVGKVKSIKDILH